MRIKKDKKDNQFKKPATSARDLEEQAQEIMQSKDVAELDQADLPDDLRSLLETADEAVLEGLEREMEIEIGSVRDVEESAEEEAESIERSAAETPQPETEAFEEEPKVDGYCTVRISEDKMSALISLYPSQHGGEPLHYDTVRNALDSAGVIFGVNEDLLKKLILTVEKTEEEKVDVMIAHGIQPEEGEDGSIQYHFSEDESILSETVDESSTH